MKKLLIFAVLGLFFSVTAAHAGISDYIGSPDYTKWKINNVWKSGHEHHVGGMPAGVKLLEPGTLGTMLVSKDGSHGAYTAQLQEGWRVDIYFDIWGKDSDRWDDLLPKARCPRGATDCAPSEWKFMTQAEDKLSTISRGEEVFMIKDFWGQKGYNAGGVNVRPENGIAWGGWGELWAKEPVICLAGGDQVCGEPNWTKHGNWDINGNKVPIPAAWIFFSFGLVGLRALGIIRKKEA